jgi:hypothetical protein
VQPIATTPSMKKAISLVQGRRKNRGVDLTEAVV